MKEEERRGKGNKKENGRERKWGCEMREGNG